MKPEDIKYIYEIDSSLDLDEVLDSLCEELNLTEGIVGYFSLSEDDFIEEKLLIDELKKKALKVNAEEEYPGIVFSDVEVVVYEDRIQIASKIKLELKGIDVDRVVEK